jgi:hypothetical protein
MRLGESIFWLVLCFIIFFLSTFAFLWIIFNPYSSYIIQGAYYSTLADCNPPGYIETITNGSVVVVGSFEPVNQTIFVNDSYSLEEMLRTQKHEICHKNQFLENRYFVCIDPRFIGVPLTYINEFECYYAETKI